MKKVLFQLLLAVLAVSSCATAKYYGGFTPEAARQDMVLLGPVSDIYYLDQNNNESFSDTLSGISETLIAGLVKELGVPVSDRVELSADEAEEAVVFMRYLANPEVKHPDAFPIPKALRAAIEAQGCRYGLILYAKGMTRDVKGYRKDAVKGALITVATAVLTLGTAVVVATADRYSSQITAAVLDAETDRVVFINKIEPEQNDPLHADPVRKQLRKLLKDYLK